jgi:RNA polymerase sigma-70 factor (sigma-E family)
MAADADSDYTEFVRTRSTALLRTAYLLTGDRGLAEDLVQTALTKVYLSWGRIRDRGAVEAYARRTLVTTATSWWRRKTWRQERPSSDTLPDFAVPAGTDEVDERARVWTCVRSLPPRQRAVIVLRYYEDLTESQTAEVLGCAVGTVKTQAHRAMQRLRLSLGESPAESWRDDAAAHIVSESP